MKQNYYSLLLLLIISVLSSLGCNQTEPFFGEWVVSKIAGTSRISAMSEAEMKSFIGKRAEYNRTLATFDGESCENPIYKKETLSETDFFSNFRTSFENLDLKGKSVTLLNVYENQKTPWINPGSYLIIKDNDTMITIWDGVFFELKRNR